MNDLTHGAVRVLMATKKDNKPMNLQPMVMQVLGTSPHDYRPRPRGAAPGARTRD